MLKFIITFAFLAFINTVQGQSLKIIGGTDAGDGDYPYQVSIKHGHTHKCAGSIITPRTILTTAYCIDNQQPEDYHVLAGTTKLNGGNGRIYRIERFETHAGFEKIDYQNNIGLVILNEFIQFDRFVKRIQIDDTFIDAGITATLTGWGRNSKNGDILNDMQTIRLKTISNEVCKEAWLPFLELTPSSLCTQGNRNEGPCRGDEGDPLVAGGKQVGIFSMGMPCMWNFPHVYVRISSYVDWINRRKI